MPKEKSTRAKKKKGGDVMRKGRTNKNVEGPVEFQEQTTMETSTNNGFEGEMDVSPRDEPSGFRMENSRETIRGIGSTSKQDTRKNTSRISAVDVRNEVNNLLHLATAPNTQETYNQGLRCFEEFQDSLNLSKIWPPTLEQIVLFIGYMSAKHLSVATARTYISAISYKLKIQNNRDETQSFLVKKLLEGFRRKVKKNDARLPITSNILNQILQSLHLVCTNYYECKLFQAAYTLAFFGFFRVGEMTVKNQKDLGHAIEYEDITMFTEENKIQIKLKHSKVDQIGEGETITIQNSQFGSQIQPIKIIQEYLAIRPSVQGKLFCHFSGQPLTRYQFTAVLNKVLSIIGLEGKKYKSHSFRIGAATSAAMFGMSEEEICKAGRWKSKAYKIYVRM
ncbi:uncharacterized protein LOC130054184 isoform X1 [Ostrea edulis]|uniref:uncharacterized protein LOC125677201 isoform X1 n=1 Tax=Ostrea edulis TaxID=37623 RepID=UPI0024AFD0D1|nr:uncharacterized protein LOC125677201 isoform X1 [Ostrea edulis]XP_055998342.1 uncharacterized protein LOC130047412 isoform X1 [Ostrea edulis]XP_056000580.1 uncharacterized protein LOC130048206 isoform X1 [Ostrea edulis]XP_056004807.1 uncharacterized protein LOC125659183 isoform X1 [Ostrea edulis]XP_056009750.1 uncharacterized protein LOC125662295 isoform X1 [Ostrea edulis]XP_056014488.1 uncharacterized protein LOC125656263 isoform X1 [Ostrea edulis]XP_056018778.1 uncharacterized protein LO